MSANSLKERLRNGEAVLGTILPLPSAEVAELIGLAGYECIMLDSEHGPLTPETLQAMARACRAVNAAPLVRVPENNPKTILRALDCGCVGVMVPQVETPEQAAAAVAATKYAPQGSRSLAGAIPASRWGTVRPADHVAASNAETVNFLQVETRRGLEAVEAIARVPGIDVLFIGPGDLSLNLGHPGQMEHPDVQAAFRRIIQTGLSAGVAVGILALTAADVGAYRRLGVTVFLDSAPRLFLRAGQTQVTSMREAAAQARPEAGLLRDR